MTTLSKAASVTRKVVWTAPLEAITSSGFIKAVVYSFISFFCVWALGLLQEVEIVNALGQFAIYIPVVNSILVLGKEYVDALRNNDK